MTSQGVRSGVHRFAWIDEVAVAARAVAAATRATSIGGGELIDAVAQTLGIDASVRQRCPVMAAAQLRILSRARTVGDPVHR